MWSAGRHAARVLAEEPMAGECRVGLTRDFLREDGRLAFDIGLDVLEGHPEIRWELLPRRTAELQARDARGYVLTGDDVVKFGRWSQERDPLLLETSVPGVFACGDVRLSPVKRVASAVGEGSMAIAFVHQYLREVESTGPAAV